MGYRMLGMPWGILGGGLGNKLGSPGGGEAPLVYLLKDLFTTAESAPLTSPRTCEPGPGTLTIVDTGNTLDISAGKVVPNAVVIGNGDPSIRTTDSLIRSTGAGIIFKGARNYQSVGGATTNSIYLGYGVDNTPVFTDMSGMGITTNEVLGVSTGNIKSSSYTVLNNIEFDGFVILRSSGFISVANDTVLWIDNSQATDPVYPCILGTVAGRAPFGFDDLKIAQLPAPWDTDNGIATQVLSGARSAGDTFTHEADCLIEAEIATIPSGGQIEIRFRVQDASNYWQVTVDSTGALDLDEVVSGIPTQRGTSAGVVANSDRLVIICDDETIIVYEAGTQRIKYTSAANFKTATSGELETEGPGGAVTDIISWPRTLSGSALSVLEVYANG